MLASLIGYAFVASCVVIIGYFVPDEQVRRPLWLFVFLALAASARFCWLHPKAPSSLGGWVLYSSYAIGAGLFLGAIDYFLKGSGNASLYLDGAMAIGGLIVTFSGAIRSAILGKAPNA